MVQNIEVIRKVRQQACLNDIYGGCSQAVLSALQDGLHIGNTETLKAATVLPGGGGWRGETCGALIGALMALGIVIGREKLEDTDKYSKAMEISQDIIKRFKNELHLSFGFNEALKNTLCSHIQEKIFGRHFNLADSNEKQAFIDAGGRTEKGCGTTCAIAAEIAAQKLLEITTKGLQINSLR
jgi:C_GCAxxG_C_C family probable redox protein